MSAKMRRMLHAAISCSVLGEIKCTAAEKSAADAQRQCQQVVEVTKQKQEWDAEVK